jgi:hypothetical protein
MEVLSSDTTVQEPAIGYPNEAGILRGLAQRVYRSLVKVKEQGLGAISKGREKAKEIFRTVKEYHLFAKGKEKKEQLLSQLVEQTKELMTHSQEVIKQVGRSAARVTQSAVVKLERMVEVSAQLLPQILQWLQTGVVATGKVLHAGITEARAIVKNKAGKRVEFPLEVVDQSHRRGVCLWESSRSKSRRAEHADRSREGLQASLRAGSSAGDERLRSWRERAENDRGVATRGSQESRDHATRESQMARCRGRPSRSALAAGEDGRSDRHAQESEVWIQSQTREKQRDVNCRWAAGDGLSEFEQADEGHRREGEESETSNSLKQEEARGEEKSEKDSGEKVEKGEEGVSKGKRARIALS